MCGHINIYWFNWNEQSELRQIFFFIRFAWQISCVQMSLRTVKMDGWRPLKCHTDEDSSFEETTELISIICVEMCDAPQSRCASASCQPVTRTLRRQITMQKIATTNKEDTFDFMRMENSIRPFMPITNAIIARSPVRSFARRRIVICANIYPYDVWQIM